MKKKFLCLLAISLLLTGCAGGNLDTKKENSQTEQSTTTESTQEEVKSYSKEYTVFKASLEDSEYDLVYNEETKSYGIIRKADQVTVGTLHPAYSTTENEGFPVDFKNSDNSQRYFASYIQDKYDITDVQYVDGEIWYVLVDGSNDVAYGTTEDLSDEEVKALQNYVLRPFWGKDDLKVMMTGEFYYDGPDKLIDKDQAIDLISKIQLKVEPTSLDGLEINSDEIYVNK